MDVKNLILWENNFEKLAFTNKIKREVILASEAWSDNNMELCKAKAL
jgi:hypothetical protein